jgi:hypothetical protein
MNQSELYNIVKWLIILIVIGFAALLVLEVKAYRFETNKSLNKSQNKYTETYYDVPIEEEGTIFNGLADYLEKIEEGKLYKESDLGCYDNDNIISEIKGEGQTCKTWAANVTDIYYKRKPNESIPTTESGKNNYFVSGDGTEYSFAEICPETSNQDRAISCLYKKGEKFNKLGMHLANVIQEVQDRQNNRIGNIDSSIKIHTGDSNRLHNKPYVTDFLRYENAVIG